MSVCEHPKSKIYKCCTLGGITYRHRLCLTCEKTWWTFEACYGFQTPPNVKELQAKKSAEEKAERAKKAALKKVSLIDNVWKRTA